MSNIVKQLVVDVDVVLGEVAVSEFLRQDLPRVLSDAAEGKRGRYPVCVCEPRTADQFDGRLVNQPFPRSVERREQLWTASPSALF